MDASAIPFILQEMGNTSLCGASEPFQTFLHSRKGHVPIQLSIVRITEEDLKGTQQYMCVCKDMSASAEMQALRAASAEAAEAAEVKSSFLATMGHEIRTPLSAITGMTEWLLETPLNEEQLDNCQNILKSSNLLMRILTDILDYSKLNADSLELENAEFHLHQSINVVCDSIAQEAYKKGLELIVDFDWELPYRVVGDEVRLQQCLYNLLTNAIKFTEKGHILLKARRQTNNSIVPDTQQIVISVADTGSGISENDLHKLFVPFSQLGSGTKYPYNRNYRGAGLGLSICKKLMNLMNGKVTAKSVLGEGSTFTLRLPMQTAFYESPVFKRRAISRPVNTILNGIVLVSVACPMLETHLRKLLFRCNIKTDTAENSDIFEQKYINNKKSYSMTFIDRDVLEDLPASTCSKIIGKEDIVVLYSPQDKRMISNLEEQGFTRHVLKPLKLKDILKQFENIGVTLKPGKMSEDLHNAYNHIVGTPSQKKRAQLSRQLITPPSPRRNIATNVLKGNVSILVAEDDELHKKIVARLLSRIDNVRFDISENGKEALSKLYHDGDKYDLCLFDCMMPVMDGYEATQQIRKLESTMQMPYRGRKPIIAVTANVMPTDKNFAMKLVWMLI
eukprot:CAMPEP_0168516300 /NCGR_PEP_ID=MMETSP0405-20121227/5323_1 /TAXON_ID=498012 /ORGANISM="Trichosphaerium sp, Strain Am-I-7 wt" /LENGTH=619 /DNA_ID=CAMNT_0008535991 /DNA_START=752 /DNA_END=2612 /DNA_ORIENTATION=-